jgi:hypothetical protein
VPTDYEALFDDDDDEGGENFRGLSRILENGGSKIRKQKVAASAQAPVARLCFAFGIESLMPESCDEFTK